MTNYYINLTSAQVTQINSFLYSKFVFDGTNYIFPFQHGTTSYLDVSKTVHFVTDLIQNAIADARLTTTEKNLLSTVLASKVTYDQAISLGWIIIPSTNV